MNFSIIIPVHNEEVSIEPLLADFIENLAPRIKPFVLEITLVENGSTDKTLERCLNLEKAYGGLVNCVAVNRPSYGEAVKTGMLKARGDHLAVLELDYLLPEFLEASREIFDNTDVKFIVASKRHPDSIDNRPRKRRILTRAFNLILKTFTGYPGSDTHGLKSIETELAKKLCHQAVTTDEVFQTEIVLLAWRLGYRIREVPVALKEQRPAPVSVTRRFPKVVNLVRDLRRSLGRFPPNGAGSVTQEV